MLGNVVAQVKRIIQELLFAVFWMQILLLDIIACVVRWFWGLLSYGMSYLGVCRNILLESTDSNQSDSQHFFFDL